MKTKTSTFEKSSFFQNFRLSITNQIVLYYG